VAAFLLVLAWSCHALYRSAIATRRLALLRVRLIVAEMCADVVVKGVVSELLA
jgi:hypothetical protein